MYLLDRNIKIPLVIQDYHIRVVCDKNSTHVSLFSVLPLAYYNAEANLSDISLICKTFITHK